MNGTLHPPNILKELDRIAQFPPMKVPLLRLFLLKL